MGIFLIKEAFLKNYFKDKLKKNKMFLCFLTILSAVTCEWAHCETCDYEKPTIEVLEFEVMGDKVKAWIEVDDEVWTGYLSQQPGYVSKGAYYPQDCNLTKSDYCLVSTVIYWDS